jgi:uncharacterized protein YbjT (DUF2867 family)
MKIVVIGGSGLIGTKVVSKLRQLGHEVVAASPSSGVNTITGEGLKEVLADTDVVVDLANSPSFEDKAVLAFFETAGRNLLAAEAAAGVKHHIALSIVGAQRVPESGYLRAKVAQENLIKASPVPYTIIQSTQFFEFLGAIAQSATSADGQTVYLPAGHIQPIAAEDVAAAVVAATLGAPVNGTIEIAGPERLPMSAMVQRYLTASGDARIVTSDEHATYFGAELTGDLIVPAGSNPHIGAIDFATWFSEQTVKA